MTKCALYHRVSTLDQNPELAREELRQAAKARGFSVALDIEETGSGAKNNRPGWQEVMAAARRHKVQAVLVWKLDRASRSALDLLSNIRALEDYGCRFIAVTQGIDIKPGGDPMSRLLMTMLAAVAEFERSLIIERTRLGLEAARRKGVKLGRPIGIVKQGDPPLLITPEEVRGQRAQGLSLAKIARHHGCSIKVVRNRLKEGA